ncbi:hypothetical protein TNCT_10211 [Trichonephila clavata]|uniref:Uncharacterized protein n=1 Tax=Trichonephila clavata TaxID=2740835 RepID=A0A8X6IA73_TRICU|nr:hypothetical protein TNCT_10211 [Trichonephila clavata]
MFVYCFEVRKFFEWTTRIKDDFRERYVYSFRFSTDNLSFSPCSQHLKVVCKTRGTFMHLGKEKILFCWKKIPYDSEKSIYCFWEEYKSLN